MKLKLLLFMAFTVVLSACSEVTNVPPHVSYTTDFDPEKVSVVEHNVRVFAEQHGLTVQAKDAENMKRLSQGQPALFLQLSQSDKSLMYVSSVGVPTTLTVDVMDYGVLPVDQLEELAAALVSRLNSDVGLGLAVSAQAR